MLFHRQHGGREPVVRATLDVGEPILADRIDLKGLPRQRLVLADVLRDLEHLHRASVLPDFVYLVDLLAAARASLVQCFSRVSRVIEGPVALALAYVDDSFGEGIGASRGVGELSRVQQDVGVKFIVFGGVRLSEVRQYLVELVSVTAGLWSWLGVPQPIAKILQVPVVERTLDQANWCRIKAELDAGSIVDFCAR